MAISFIGQATGTNTATMPAHAAGDLIVVFAYRDGSNTAPTLASGYTSWHTAGVNTNSCVVGYKIAASSSETVGTWTNATSTIVHVYRATGTISAGAAAGTGSTAATVTYPALTLQDAGGASWVVAFAGHRQINVALETPPGAMVNRSSVLDATDEAAGHDTNGGVTSWASTNVAVGGTSSGWRTVVLEIKESLPEPLYKGSAGQATVYLGTKTEAQLYLGAKDLWP